METDSPVVYHGTSESRFSPDRTKGNRDFQLTKEEARILSECNRESFYSRCLPMSAMGMAGAYLAVKNGLLKAHPKWGAAGKMTGACFLGYVLGKFSYRKICEDKFLKLENSAIGDIVRRKRGYTSERFESEGKLGSEDFSFRDSKYQTSSVSKDDYHNSLSLDMDKNIQYSGLDDRDRPSTDRDALNLSDSSESVRNITSYEELRRKNREEHENKLQRPPPRSDVYSPFGTRRPFGDSDARPSNPMERNPPSGGVKNAYGDSWDNPKFT